MANEHSGHRDRLRERYLSEGLDGFPPHNVLELLLFYSVPRRDTNVLAHRLIEQFGSLVGVLNAAPEQLAQVEGIGMNAAVHLHLVADIARRYYAEAVRRKGDTGENLVELLERRLDAVVVTAAMVAMVGVAGPSGRVAVGSDSARAGKGGRAIMASPRSGCWLD